MTCAQSLRWTLAPKYEGGPYVSGGCARKLLTALPRHNGTLIVYTDGMSDLKRMSQRTLELQCAVIDAYRRLQPQDEAEGNLWEELLKTLRSLANNSAESDGTQSRKDFITKFHICLKEGREGLQLLRAMIHATPTRALELQRFAKSCDEIVAILVTSLKTAKANEEAEDGVRNFVCGAG